MPEFETDTLLPPKHGVMTPFAKIAWAMIAFVVVGVGWVVLKPFRPGMFRGASGYLESARAAMTAKDFDQASRDLANAYHKAPNNLDVIRQIVRFLETTGTDATALLAMIEKLNQQGASSPELQLLMAQTLLRLGRVAEAHRAYDHLPETIKSGTGALELMAGVLTAEGQPREAAEFARRAVLSMPDSPEKEFRLAVMDARHPYEMIKLQARDTFWKLAESKSDFSLKSMVYLAADPDLDERGARKLLKWLGPNSTKQALTVRLAVISSLARIRPDLRSALFREEVELFRQNALSSGLSLAEPPAAVGEQADPVQSASNKKNSGPLKSKAPEPELDEDLKNICRWLASEKEHALLLELIPLKKALGSEELFASLVRALVEDQRWSDLKKLLDENKTPADPIRVSFWLAEAESHLQNDMQKSRSLLMRAIDAAGDRKDIPLLLAAAATCESLNEQDLALAAYQKIAGLDSNEAESVLQEALNKAELLKDTTALLSISRKLHMLKPDNIAFADRLAYMRLIDGMEIEMTDFKTPISRDLEADRTQEYIPHALLQALQAYRFSDMAAMKEWLLKLRPNDQLCPGQRAVVAGLLARAGRMEEAFQIAEKIPKELLLMEEAELLKPAL